MQTLLRSTARASEFSQIRLTRSGTTNVTFVRPVRKNGAIRWKSKEGFITEVLPRERMGALQVYFGEASSWSPGWRDCKIQPKSYLFKATAKKT